MLDLQVPGGQRAFFIQPPTPAAPSTPGESLEPTFWIYDEGDHILDSAAIYRQLALGHGRSGRADDDHVW